MAYCDHTAIEGARIQKVRDESKDFGRNTVDRCKPIPQRFDEPEDLYSVLLEIIDLEHDTD